MLKILLIKTSSMGDVVHTLAALTDAYYALGTKLRCDWVIEENFAEIPAWHPAVARIIPVALRRWRREPLAALKKHEWQNFYRLLVREHYDYVIDAQGLIKSACLTRFSKGRRCGFDFNSAREALASLFYQQRYKIAKNQHAVTRLRQLFSSVLNYPLPKDMPHYGIDTSRLQIRPNLSPLAEKTVLFIHGSSRDNKCWPESHWIALGKLAENAGYTVQIVWGSEQERQRSERIAAACPSATVAPKLKLTEVAILLSRASGAVAVDTGLGHLAAALGTPTVSLYGPTNPQLIGTYGSAQAQLAVYGPANSGNAMATLLAKDAWKQLLQIISPI